LPKFDVQLKIFIRRLADEIGWVLTGLLVGDHCAVLKAPVALADPVPIAHGLVVEQRRPAITGLARGLRRQLDGGYTQRQEAHSQGEDVCCKSSLHGQTPWRGQSGSLGQTMALLQVRSARGIFHALPPNAADALAPMGIVVAIGLPRKPIHAGCCRRGWQRWCARPLGAPADGAASCALCPRRPRAGGLRASCNAGVQ